VIGGLAALNYFGIRPGALTSDFFSGAKLIPILFFVGLGLLFVDWHRLALPAPAGETTVAALKLGGFAALFACTGFEYVPVAAGETENPRRNVPLALFFALLGSVLLYALVQIVFMGTHPDPAAADKPLAEAAGAFAGPWAGRFVAVGSVISSFGYLTAVALVTPRYLSALAENGELPPLFARTHPRFGTPTLAIGLTALVCAGLAVFADFDRLSDLNNAAVFAQYVPTCLAVPVLRRTKGTSAFHLPFGATIPILATLGCILFLNGIKRDDAIFSVGTLAVGLALHGAWRAFGRRAVAEAG
jgi:basic amino acid/polyamine antiporter, APA family